MKRQPLKIVSSLGADAGAEDRRSARWSLGHRVSNLVRYPMHRSLPLAGLFLCGVAVGAGVMLLSGRLAVPELLMPAAPTATSAASPEKIPSYAIVLPVPQENDVIDNTNNDQQVPEGLDQDQQRPISASSAPAPSGSTAVAAVPDADGEARRLATDASFDALQRLQDLRLRYPDHAVIEAALARYLVRQDDLEGAKEHALQALRLDPDNLAYRLDLAGIKDRLGQVDAALADYHRVLDQAEDSAPGISPYNDVPLAAIRDRIRYLTENQ